MKKSLILIAGLLAGCGFHATPHVNPALAELQYDCGSVQAPLCGLLANRLISSGYQLTPAASHRLVLNTLQISSPPSPLGATINRQYYDVNAALTFAITTKKHPMPQWQTIYAHRLALTNANQLEGSQRQLQQVHADLVQDLISLLQLRISRYEDTSSATQRPARSRTTPAATH